GAQILVYCERLFQDDYYEAVKKIEELGLKGTMRVLDDGPVELKLEGLHKSIEAILSKIDDGSLFKAKARKTCAWLPFRNAYQKLVTQPYIYHMTKLRSSGDF